MNFELIEMDWNWLTVHLCGFSPVWRRMWTTSMYWALNGFSSREHSRHRQTKLFLLAWMWSLLICLTRSSWVANSLSQSRQWQCVSIKSPGSSFIGSPEPSWPSSSIGSTTLIVQLLLLMMMQLVVVVIFGWRRRLFLDFGANFGDFGVCVMHHRVLRVRNSRRHGIGWLLFRHFKLHKGKKIIGIKWWNLWKCKNVVIKKAILTSGLTWTPLIAWWWLCIRLAIEGGWWPSPCPELDNWNRLCWCWCCCMADWWCNIPGWVKNGEPWPPRLAPKLPPKLPVRMRCACNCCRWAVGSGGKPIAGLRAPLIKSNHKSTR